MINKIKDFWEESSCGEELYLKGFNKNDYINHSKFRYNLEPEILDFINSTNFNNKKTLEIGVGLGSDHEKLAKAGAILTGIDLTERAILHTKRRFDLIFEIFECKDINDLISKISLLKKQAKLEDNLIKLNIDIKSNYENIIKGINLLRLGNNPIQVDGEDIIKIIKNQHNINQNI